MTIKAVLFDLDGTLLPMDQEKFTKGYFDLLCRKFSPMGYEPQKLVESVWKGTKAMVENNGPSSNEEVFWQHFAEIYGTDSLKDKPYFDEFYINEFNNVKAYCGYNEQSKKAVSAAKKLGFRVVLATNPVFPTAAVYSRIKWAGLDPSDFEIITTYENSCGCKPNLKYYSDIAKKLNLEPCECLMVGNDVKEDMVSKSIGMDVFLLTDCMINSDGEDIAPYKNGGFSELINLITNMK